MTPGICDMGGERNGEGFDASKTKEAVSKDQFNRKVRKVNAKYAK
jgi:hypothetical protein